MQIHQLQRQNKYRRGQRVGRGGKRGTFSGRGTKGQHARAGAKFRPAERDILKRIPKLRGYKFKSFQKKPAVVNLAAIEKAFTSGSIVSPESLVKAGLVQRRKGKLPKVKILGTGELKKKLEFKDVLFSRPVRRKLEI